MVPTVFSILAIGRKDYSALPSDFFARVRTYLRIQFAIIILWWTSLWAVKAAFLTMHRQFFRDTTLWQRRGWWVIAVSCGLCYAACIITLCFSCSPTSDYFELGSCTTRRDLEWSNFSLYFSTAVDILTDLPSKLVEGLTASSLLIVHSHDPTS